MTETITSVSNPKIKNLVALQQKSSERRSQGLFVVEGRRELQHCIDAGFTIDSVFFCPEIFYSGQELPSENVSLSLDECEFTKAAAAARPARDFAGQSWKGLEAVGSGGVPPVRVVPRVATVFGGDSCPEPKIFEVNRQVYEKISYREGTEGVIAEVRCRQNRLEDLKLGPNPLVCVLESVEKPGNLGAVLRSADAVGADAVIICDPRTDLYNPNLIRASIGAAFTVPVAACDSAEAIKWLKANKIKILTAQLQDSELYYDSDMTGGTAIVMGTEDKGLSGQWRSAADAHIRIPMLGRLDSLNVSVSAAILLFEALRQRNNG